jgi:E3 ubiquitin-protein ligase ZSWIM2
MVLYDVALSSRYFLVQESGPTKFTLEASNGKKYKIQFGSEVTCSCGGGRKEHCVHTIYAMMKILKIDEADPLLWQLSFTDTEVDKILQRREAETLRNRNAAHLWQE